MKIVSCALHWFFFFFFFTLRGNSSVRSKHTPQQPPSMKKCPYYSRKAPNGPRSIWRRLSQCTETSQWRNPAQRTTMKDQMGSLVPIRSDPIVSRKLSQQLSHIWSNVSWRIWSYITFSYLNKWNRQIQGSQRRAKKKKVFQYLMCSTFWYAGVTVAWCCTDLRTCRLKVFLHI